MVYSQPRNIFVKRDVKLTEPPDAEPHVRWCERSAAKAASYSIENIMKLQKKKRELADQILEGENLNGSSLTREELVELLTGK